MLYDPKKIGVEITDIVQNAITTGSAPVEIGLVNLSNSGSVIKDKSSNLGWEIYAKPGEGPELRVVVHFSEAFNTYSKLRSRFKEWGIETQKGRYDFIMDIPEND
ncbi:hypothetical protein ISS07_01550 [Candidatus Woesearchaeota archaeon]|nr:hypothetical protein [Candidatus Woesearchaeota archaeon]